MSEIKKISKKQLKVDFIKKAEESLMCSSKLNFLKLLIEYRCDEFSNAYTSNYFGLKEAKDWADNNFSKERILASWIKIRNLNKIKK
jgi:hypothetical protein